MPDRKTSQESDAVLLTGNELVAIVQSTSDAKTTLDRIIAEVAQVIKQSPHRYAWAVLDNGDVAAIGVTDDGTLIARVASIDELVTKSITAPEFNTPEGGLGTKIPYGWAIAILDGSDITTGGVLDDGTLRFKNAKFTVAEATDLTVARINGVNIGDYLAGGSGAALVSPEFESDIIGHFSYGQSLSVGVNGTPIISSVPRFNNIRFATGVRPGDDNTAGSGFVPLVEQIQPGYSYVGETPVTGAAECIIERIQSENNTPPSSYQSVILGAATGVSATKLADLSKGGPGGYSSTISVVNTAITSSNSIGKTFKLGSFSFTQGTSDYQAGTSQATYQSLLSQLVIDFNTDIKALTKQVDDIYFFCGQSADHFSAPPGIALAQLALSKIDPRFVIACPLYFFPSGDGTHLDGLNYKWLGAFYGLAHKRTLIDKKVWLPLDCIEAFMQGTVIHVRFHVPVPPLVFDTTQIGFRDNYGFQVFNSAGSEFTLSSVTLTGPSTVRIISSTPITPGSVLRYGGKTVPPTSTGGNLRDSQGDSIVFNPTGINKRLDNWCVIFERAL